MRIKNKKILFITEDFPSALSGTTVRSRSTIDSLLALGYKVDVICFLFDKNKVPKYFHKNLKVHLIKVSKTPMLSLEFIKKIYKNTFTLFPFLIRRVFKPEFQEKVQELIAKNNYSSIIISGLAMQQYFPDSNSNTYLMVDEDFTDLYRQRSILETNIFKKIFHFSEYLKGLIYERVYLKKFTSLWAISPNTKNRLSGVSKVKATIMPTDIPLMKNVFKKSSKNIVFTGTLNWPENVEGLKWFLSTQWNKILRYTPEAHLVVIGQGASQNLINFLESYKNITYKGFVDSLEQEYAKAALAIAPIRINAGIKVKILTYLSYGIPVVSTVKAAWGLNSGGVLVASEANFAKTVIMALRSQKLRTKLSKNAHLNIRKNYSTKRLSEFLVNNLTKF